MSERAEESRASRSSKLLEDAGIDVGNIGLDDKNLGALGSALSDDDQMGFDDVMVELRDAAGASFNESTQKYDKPFQEIFDKASDGMTLDGKALMNAFGVAMDGRQEASTEAAQDAADPAAPFAKPRPDPNQRDLFKDDAPTTSTPDTGAEWSIGLPPEGAPKSEVEEFGGKVWTSDPLHNKLQELQDKYDRQGAQSLTPDELGSLFSGKMEEGTAISEELSPQNKRRRLMANISGLRDLIGKVGKADPNLPAIRGELNKLENDLVEVEADLVVKEKADPKDKHPLFDNDLHRQLSTEDYGYFAEHENSPFVIQKGVNKGKRMDTSPIETWRRDASALASQFRGRYPVESADWAWEAFTHTLAQAQKVVSDLKEHGRNPMSEEVMGAYGKFGGKKVLFNKFIDFANKEKRRVEIMQEAGAGGEVGRRGDSWRFTEIEGVGKDLDKGRDVLSDVVESMDEINGEPLDISASDNKSLGATIDAGIAENFPSSEERTPQSTASREEAKSKISKYLTDFRNALYKQLGVDRAPSSEFEEWGTVNLTRRVMKEVIIPSVIPALERKNQKPSKLGRLIKRRNKIEKELPTLTANLNNINGQTFQKVIKVINSSVAKITAAKLYTDEALAEKAAADIAAGVSPMTPETQVLHRSLLEDEVTRIVESGILPENSDAVLKVPSGGATVSITAKELIGQLSARKSLLEKNLKEVQTKIDVTADSEVNIRGYEKIKIREKIAKLYKEFNRNRAKVGEGMVELKPPRPSERAKGPYSDYKLDEAYRLVVRKSQQSIMEAGVEEEAFLEASVEAEAYAKSREARLKEGAEVEDTLTNQARNNPLYDQNKGNLHVSEAIKNLVARLTGNDAARAKRLKPLLDLATEIDTEVFLARIQALDGGNRPPAFYSGYTDQIVVDTVGQTHSEAFDVMVEEFFHALTADKLATDSEFRSEVESIRKKAAAVFDKLTPEQRKAMGDDVVSSMDYALESNVEFLAAVMKSFELQELLAGIKTSKKFRGRWANVLEQLIAAFKKTIGFVVEEETLLDDAIFVAMQATKDKLSNRREGGIKPSDPRAKAKVYRVTQQPHLLKYSSNYHSQVYSQIEVDESSHSEIAQPKPATDAAVDIGLQGTRDNIDGKDISDAVGEAFAQGRPDPNQLDLFKDAKPTTAQGRAFPKEGLTQAEYWRLELESRQRVDYDYHDKEIDHLTGSEEEMAQEGRTLESAEAGSIIQWFKEFYALPDTINPETGFTKDSGLSVNVRLKEQLVGSLRSLGIEADLRTATAKELRAAVAHHISNYYVEQEPETTPSGEVWIPNQGKERGRVKAYKKFISRQRYTEEGEYTHRKAAAYQRELAASDINLAQAFAQGETKNYLETTLEFDKKLAKITNAREALEFIANESPSAEARALAQGLLKGTSPNVDIETVPSLVRGDDVQASGLYYQSFGEAGEAGGLATEGIQISEKAPSKVHATLHEIAHAKTLRARRAVIKDSMERKGLNHLYPLDQRKWAETILGRVDDFHQQGQDIRHAASRAEMGVAELHFLFDRLSLREDFAPHYGSGSVDEMIAEAWSNPNFRKYLKGIKVSDLQTGKRNNFLFRLRRERKIDNLWDLFKSTISSILGLNIEEADVLSRVMDASSEVMAYPSPKTLASKGYIGQGFEEVFLAPEEQPFAQGRPDPDSALENVTRKQEPIAQTEGPTRASMSRYEKFKEKFVTKSQILDSFVKRMFKDKGISHDLEVPLAGLHELLSGSVQAANAAVDNFVYDVEALIGNKEETTKQFNNFVLLERIKERLRNDRDSKVKDGVRVEQLEEKLKTDGDTEIWEGTEEEKIELLVLLGKSKEVAPYKSVADITRPNGLNDGIRELIAKINDPSLLTEIESGVYTGKFVEASAVTQTHMERSLFGMFEAGLITLRGYNRMASSTSFYVPFYVAKHFSGQDTFGQLIKGIKGVPRNEFPEGPEGDAAHKKANEEATKLAPMMDAIKFKLYTTKMRVDKNVFMGKIDDFREEFDPDGTHIRVMTADEQKKDKIKFNWDTSKFYRNGRLHYIKMERDITDLFNNFNPANATVAGRALKGAGDIFKLGATGINAFFQIGNFLFFDPIRLLTTSKAGLRAKDKGLSPIVLGHQYLKALMAASWRNMLPNSIKNLIRSSTTFDTTKMDTLYQKFIDSGAAGSTIAEYFDKARAIPDPVGKHGGIFRDEGKITKTLNWLNAKASLWGKTLEQTAKMVGMQRMEIFEGIDELITEVEAENNVEKKMRLQKALEKKRDAIAIEIRNYAGSPDFMRKGSVTENEALNVIFMFFNARIQGVERDMSRLSKVFSGKKADRNLALASGLKLSAFAAAPTMMVWAMNRRYKDDYDEISDEEKKRYFMIPLSTKFEHPYIEGKMIRDYIRLPRRESFGLFSYTLEKGLDFFYDEDPAAASESVEFMVEFMLPVNVDGLLELKPVKTAESVASSLNPMIKGVFEQVGNRNFFRHKPLVPPSMENADPEDQYYTSTPDIYKWLGGSTGLGAIRAKHLTESMTAGMFTQFMPPKDTGREGFASTPLMHRLARSSYIKESDVAEIMDAADKVDATGRVQRRRMADEWFMRTKGMSIQERVMNLPKPKNHSEKLLNDLIVRRLRQQAVGMSPDEIRMKNSPVNVRASVVLSQIEDMTPAEVKVYLTDLARKRILTRETIIAVNQRLKDRGVTLRDYVQ